MITGSVEWVDGNKVGVNGGSYNLKGVPVQKDGKPSHLSDIKNGDNIKLHGAADAIHAAFVETSSKPVPKPDPVPAPAPPTQEEVPPGESKPKKSPKVVDQRATGSL